MCEWLRVLAAGRAAIENNITELSPLLAIEALNKEVVDLLIEKILIHGEKDIEIVWNGRYDE